MKKNITFTVIFYCISIRTSQSSITYHCYMN